MEVIFICILDWHSVCIIKLWISFKSSGLGEFLWHFSRGDVSGRLPPQCQVVVEVWVPTWSLLTAEGQSGQEAVPIADKQAESRRLPLGQQQRHDPGQGETVPPCCFLSGRLSPMQLWRRSALLPLSEGGGPHLTHMGRYRDASLPPAEVQTSGSPVISDIGSEKQCYCQARMKFLTPLRRGWPAMSQQSL